jgi:tetrapyrrole methylase family protein / MazG family protein
MNANNDHQRTHDDGTAAENPLNDPAWLATVLAAVAVDLSQGYQCVPATYLASHYYPQIEGNLPLLIAGVASPALIAPLVRALDNAFPRHHPVRLVWRGADGEPVVQSLRLDEVAALHTVDPTSWFYLPPLPSYSSFTALQEIVAHLRSAQGCPWDRAQTLATMRHDLLSECAEVIEAIDADLAGADNSQQVAEELGDLLMAAVLMVQIATDAGRFQMAEVVQSIVTKLRRRHPHVFGEVAVDGVETVLANWDAIKAQEKAAKGVAVSHPLEGVPAALPALEKARQLQAKAVKAALLDRSALAVANRQLAALMGDKLDEPALGELLWQIVARAHQAGLNPEDALRSYIVRWRAAYGVV